MDRLKRLRISSVRSFTHASTFGPLMKPNRSAARFIGILIWAASMLASRYRLNWFMRELACELSPLNSGGGFPPSFASPPPPGAPGAGTAPGTPPPGAPPPGKPPPGSPPPAGPLGPPPPPGGFPDPLPLLVLGFPPKPQMIGVLVGACVPANVSAAAAVLA